MSTEKTYRWSGSTFVVISETLALGETSSTAYRGDRGKVAYEHSQTAHAPSNAQQNVQSDWNATSGDAFIKNKPKIPTKVGELTNDKDYATKTEVTKVIDNLEIGGRNLLLNSSFELTGNPNWIGLSDYAYITKEGMNGGYCSKQIGKLNESHPLINSASLKVKANDVFTFSGWYKVQDYISGMTNNYVRPYVQYLKSDGAWVGETEILNISPDATDWTYVKASFKVPNIQEIDYMKFILYARDYTGIIWWDDLKLEKGNKATDWTPAPEDTEEEIQSVDNKLTTNMLKPTLGTTTQNGVTCTNNGDGTYTLNGTATSQPIFWLNENVNVIGSNLKLVCCPPSVISDKQGYSQIMYDNNEWGEKETVDGVAINSGKNILKVIFTIHAGCTVNNLVIKPMLTTNLNATYDDFVPYTGSTGQINSDVAEVRKDFDEHTHEITDVTGLQSTLAKKADKEKYGDTVVSVGRKANTTIGKNSFAFGKNVTASGAESHAEGYGTTASHVASHAEGEETTASGVISHAEGWKTTASGEESHAEGEETTASGIASHAEGDGTTASGQYSHAEGEGTIASAKCQHVQGAYNIEDTEGKYAFIVGNGTSDTNRSNAFTVDKEGISWSKKDVKAGDVSLVGLKNDLDEKIGDYHLDFGYKSKSEVAIVANKTITVSSNTFTWKTENDKTFMCTSNNPFSDVWNPTDAPDICGIIFKVVWDGTEYILLGHERDRLYAQGIDEQYLFGNTSLLGYSNSSDDDTIPFLVVVGRWGNTNADQKSLKILTNDTSSASHTISISRIEMDYKKIPPYYLDTLHKSSKLIHKGSGQCGIVIGMATDASGEGSVAEGECTITSGYASHAEGEQSTASGEASHAEGAITTASGTASHAEGLKTTASGSASHAEGAGTTSSGHQSHAEGEKTIASGNDSHAEGNKSIASGVSSHAEGQRSNAMGAISHAEGASEKALPDTITSSTTNDDVISAWNTTKFSLAKGVCSHTEGLSCLSLGNSSHAEGYRTIAKSIYSHAEGDTTKAMGDYSHAEGRSTTALANQHAQGHYNSTTTATANSTEGTSTGTAFVIGNGTSSSPSNAFRVTGEGVIYATNAAVQTGADYAEYFEWSDGNPDNEDRVGLFVTFDEDNPEKIRIANSNDDYILGIVSGMPSVIGNGDEDWKKRYVLDDFGRYIQETFEYMENDETKIGTKWKENPEYDNTKPYAPRAERAEWSTIGLVGVLSVYDDGTCQVNGYCKCKNNGIATAAEKGVDTYRVIKRVNDNIVKVVLK